MDFTPEQFGRELEELRACLQGDDVYQRLHRSLQKDEVDLRWNTERTELYRFNRVASIDVFYTAKDGRRYRLEEETRITLPVGTAPDEYFKDNGVVISTADRVTYFSVTELMRLSAQNYLNEAARGVMEEVFDFAMSEWREKERMAARDWIRHKISRTVPRSEEVKVDADSPENSFPGIRSEQENHIFELHLTHNDDLIQEVDGIPTRQIEFIPEKGYLNISTWKLVTE